MEVSYPPVEIKTIDGRFVKLKADEIIRISASGNYAEFHNKDGKFVVRNTLKNIENDLSHINFIRRIHRSHLINFKKIKSYNSKSVKLEIGEAPIGSNYINALK